MDGPVQGELGKYRLIAEIARGGMGIVYLAIAPGPGGFYKTLVIKQLKPDLAAEPSFLAMFLDEARVAAKLQHPNIVQVYEVDSVGERTFLAMEYLEGCTLRRALKALRPAFTTAMHLEVISEILRVRHAHELTDESGSALGLVHRDMNPHNIFVTFDGQAKIVDFGIVKTLDSSQHTATGVFKGKIAYMPPEQLMADMGVDRRADIYSVGVMLWEAAAERRLWKGLQDMHILAKLVQKERPLLESVKPDAPAELRRICARAMAWKRDERYATAAEFREDLDQYLATLPVRASMRDVGAVLALGLEEERAQMKALVDRKIAQLKAGEASMTTVSVAPPSSTSGVSDLDPDDSGPIVGVDPALLERRRKSSRPHAAALEEDEDEVDVDFSSEVLSTRWQRVRSPIIVGLVAVSIIALYVLLVVPSSRTQATNLAHDSPALASASAALPPPVPEMIDVEIRVMPSNATVAIDDAVLGGSSPFSARYAKGTTTHVARASAPGYATRTQQFSAGRDVMLDLSLVRSQGMNVAGQPARDGSQPASTGSSLRPIDTASPYAGATGGAH